MSNITNAKELLDKIQSYCSFEEFKSNLGYLDIETTGLSSDYHYITMVGIYSKNKPRTYVEGNNLEFAKADVENHDYIVTFNGIRFDIPFMEKKLYLEKKFSSIDLMYLLREIGYRGGLKKIESDLGLSRDKLVEGMGGKDALRLWSEYKKGNPESLQKLIQYNKEDIINLEVLMNFIYYKANNYPVTEKHILFWKEDILKKIC